MTTDSNGRPYEQVKFSNGMIDYFYTYDLHKINHICYMNGLKPENYKDFQKAFEILRSQENG
jgi:hypothetical protein